MTSDLVIVGTRECEAVQLIIEPGDCTRYNIVISVISDNDMLVTCVSPGGFCFTLRDWEIQQFLESDQSVDSPIIKRYAADLNENPWTIRACFLAVQIVVKPS